MFEEAGRTVSAKACGYSWIFLGVGVWEIPVGWCDQGEGVGGSFGLGQVRRGCQGNLELTEGGDKKALSRGES